MMGSLCIAHQMRVEHVDDFATLSHPYLILVLEAFLVWLHREQRAIYQRYNQCSLAATWLHIQMY